MLKAWLRHLNVPGDRECENEFCVVFLCQKFLKEQSIRVGVINNIWFLFHGGQDIPEEVGVNDSAGVLGTD